MSDFEKKAELVNNHFASQCSSVKNASDLPNIKYKTDEWLNSIEINENDILSVIKNLNAWRLMGGLKYRLEWSNYAVKQ